jgi:membrane protein
MTIPLGGTIGWGALFKRTLKETAADNCFGLAAQLAYYFFLSVFPALLVVVALTSVFPRNLLEQTVVWLGSFTPPDVLQILSAQIELITKSGHAGLLTFGALGALWSSSSAMNATIDTLNRAYGIHEARSWWKVQLLAIVLTIIMSVFVLVAFTMVIAGPEIAEKVAARRPNCGSCLIATQKTRSSARSSDRSTIAPRRSGR